MGAEQAHQPGIRLGQFAQPLLVADTRLGIDLNEVLERPEPGRTMGRRLYFAVMKVRITTVQQPAIGGAHGDAAMTACVAVQRNQQHVVTARRQRPYCVESEPALTVFAVQHPLRIMREMGTPVPRPFAARGPYRSGVFTCVDMNLRIGEVRQSACVIEIQVGDHDVADIGRAVAECGHVGQRRFSLVEFRPRHCDERTPESSTGLGDVGCPNAGVDQYEAVIAFHEQAMTDHPPRTEPAPRRADQLAAVRTHRAAIEMVDAQTHDRQSRWRMPISRFGIRGSQMKLSR